MNLPYLDADTVSRLLPIGDAISLVEQVFVRAATVEDPLRTVVDVPAGQLLLMPSRGGESVGVKVVSIGVGNPARDLPRIQGVYVLMDADTLTPRALMDGTALTALRTPAVSAAATARLAVPEASTLAVLGAGPQAEAHVHAIRTIRPITTVVVVTRSAPPGAALVERLREHELDMVLGGPDDLSGADVVCACTTSRVPVVEAARLADHAHVNAIGSHEPAAREVDSIVVRRAQIAVETRAAALAEAGDLLIPLHAGEIDETAIDWDLAELLRGDGAPPVPERLSLFKSVGIAFEDLIVAEEVARRWFETTL